MNPHHQTNIAHAQGMDTPTLKAAIARVEGMTAEDMPPPLATGEERRQWMLSSYRFELAEREKPATPASEAWTCCGVPVRTVGLSVACMGACGRVSR